MVIIHKSVMNGGVEMNNEICKKCDSIMDCETTIEIGDVYTCPFCGWGFFGEGADYEEFESYERDSVDVPDGCLGCGGPYPLCKSSCRMFEG